MYKLWKVLELFLEHHKWFTPFLEDITGKSPCRQSRQTSLLEKLDGRRIKLDSDLSQTSYPIRLIIPQIGPNLLLVESN